MNQGENKVSNDAVVWNTCGYVRLSREDGDKGESNSVTGQKEFIRNFLSHHPELRECGMRVDDGYTGSNFDRPAFQEMMDDVRAGRVKCIVVKDLSRFGRNYLDAGEYIENIFPFLGVRFIAINDNYDSMDSNAASNELLIPFKNLINEAYCRDASIKIRSQLEIKRKRGDFIGSFAVYGYLKDPKENHRLIVDDYAADVVRDIFKWKLEGVSVGDIAGRLNRAGILAPMDYKKAMGFSFATPFRVHVQSRWYAVTILRILKNPVYTGVLVQGRNTTPNYKIARRIVKPREEWAVVADRHEAIVDRCDFENVQRVLALDTRTSPGHETVERFSGMVFCGECGAAMIRKTVPSGGKKYVYYVCAAHKNEKTCSSHSLRDRTLEEIVLASLKLQIQTVIELSELLETTNTARLQKASVRKLQGRLEKNQEEIDRCQRLLHSLYENLADGVIDREEYLNLKETYATRREEAEKQAQTIQNERDLMLDIGGKERGWLEQLKKHQTITGLDRAMIVSLIERIFIFKDKRVELVCRWQDEFLCQTNPFMQGRVISKKATV